MTAPRRTASVGNPGIGCSFCASGRVCGEDETKAVLVVLGGAVVWAEVECLVLVEVVAVLGIALNKIAAEYASRRTLVTAS